MRNNLLVEILELRGYECFVGDLAIHTRRRTEGDLEAVLLIDGDTVYVRGAHTLGKALVSNINLAKIALAHIKEGKQKAIKPGPGVKPAMNLVFGPILLPPFEDPRCDLKPLTELFDAIEEIFAVHKRFRERLEEIRREREVIGGDTSDECCLQHLQAIDLLENL